jgi:hypothetical protein
MSRHLHRPALAAVVLVFAAAADGVARDPQRESLERFLGHEAGHGVPHAGMQPDAEPLIDATVAPRRDCIGRAPPRAADPVADSFARIEVQAPSTNVPPVAPVPAESGDAPLVARVVETLRRWLADGGTAAGHGTALACRTGR